MWCLISGLGDYTTTKRLPRHLGKETTLPTCLLTFFIVNLWISTNGTSVQMWQSIRGGHICHTLGLITLLEKWPSESHKYVTIWCPKHLGNSSHGRGCDGGTKKQTFFLLGPRKSWHWQQPVSLTPDRVTSYRTSSYLKPTSRNLHKFIMRPSPATINKALAVCYKRRQDPFKCPGSSRGPGGGRQLIHPPATLTHATGSAAGREKEQPVTI